MIFEKLGQGDPIVADKEPPSVRSLIDAASGHAAGSSSAAGQAHPVYAVPPGSASTTRSFQRAAQRPPGGGIKHATIKSSSIRTQPGSVSGFHTGGPCLVSTRDSLAMTGDVPNILRRASHDQLQAEMRAETLKRTGGRAHLAEAAAAPGMADVYRAERDPVTHELKIDVEQVAAGRGSGTLADVAAANAEVDEQAKSHHSFKHVEGRHTAGSGSGDGAGGYQQQPKGRGFHSSPQRGAAAAPTRSGAASGTAGETVGDSSTGSSHRMGGGLLRTSAYTSGACSAFPALPTIDILSHAASLLQVRKLRR